MNKYPYRFLIKVGDSEDTLPAIKYFVDWNPAKNLWGNYRTALKMESKIKNDPAFSSSYLCEFAPQTSITKKDLEKYIQSLNKKQFDRFVKATVIRRVE